MRRQKWLHQRLTSTAEVRRQQEAALHAPPRIDRFPWLQLRQPRPAEPPGLLARFLARLAP